MKYLRYYRLPIAVVLLVIGAALVAPFSVRSQETQSTDPPQDRRAAYMRIKLQHAQQLLEALTLEDYDGIARHAEALSLTNLESRWNVLQTPEYVRRSEDFQRQTSRLAEAAAEENLDRAALRYLEVTMSCIECHQYVRSRRPVGSSDDGGP